MSAEINVSNVSIRLVQTHDANFIGYASCVVNDGLRLDNMKIMRSREGNLVVRFPGAERTPGRQRPPYYPTTADARRTIEEALFAELARLSVRMKGVRS